jgi:hypothetical protein
LESIDFKGSNLYVRNGFRWKIFGSKWKVLISNGQTYMFGTDSVGKYSVQNWKVLISKVLISKVKPICSEWIPLENIRFKIGIFIDWEVVRLPPPSGWGAGMALGDVYCVALPYMVCHCEYH